MRAAGGTIVAPDSWNLGRIRAGCTGLENTLTPSAPHNGPGDPPERPAGDRSAAERNAWGSAGGTREGKVPPLTESLRRLYDRVVEEPLPASFEELLKGLERNEKG